MNHHDGQETLARYIYSRNQFRASDHTVKYSAFIPPENRCLSVFKISGLEEDEIWRIGERLRIQTLLARADIKDFFVRRIGLEIESDDIPPRHANIVGWPEESSAVKLKAIELAQKSELHLK